MGLNDHKIQPCGAICRVAGNPSPPGALVQAQFCVRYCFLLAIDIRVEWAHMREQIVSLKYGDQTAAVFEWFKASRASRSNETVVGNFDCDGRV